MTEGNSTTEHNSTTQRNATTEQVPKDIHLASLTVDQIFDDEEKKTDPVSLTVEEIFDDDEEQEKHIDPAGLSVDRIFDDDEMQVDETPLDAETYRLLAQYDDPWADLKDPHVMLNFYRKVFPWKQLFLWLNQDYAPNHLFTHREFAVTLQNDAYLRYNSYSSYLDLQKDIIRLNPSRFEIGPSYSAPPRDKKTIPKAAFRPIMRELVFDIDLTDYDDVRICCSDKKICKKCWKFIPLAVKVLDETLRMDFGFNHLLWVYSGRRGIHCWVSDREALTLNDEQRKAIVNYIDLMRGGKSKSGLKVNVKTLHPMVQRSKKILDSGFEEVMLKDQDFFKNEANRKILMQACESSNLSSMSKLTEFISDSKTKTPEEVKANIIFHCTYPRIDLEVSKHLNHLLKSPFCVHPATGKICVPIDPKKVDQFDPDQVPDVRDLLRELDKKSKLSNDETASSNIQLNWSHTALKPYVEIFENHVKELLKGRLEGQKDPQKISLDF